MSGVPEKHGGYGSRMVDGYRAHLGTAELIGALSRLVEQQRTVEHLLCRYLADLADRIAERSHIELLGYNDVYHAARRLFGMSGRRTRERIRIGRALRELHAIEDAFVQGELGYSQVRELTRVAKKDDQDAWIGLAKRLPIRQLEQRVAESGDAEGYRERAADKAKEPAALLWRSPKTVEVHLTMSTEAWALLERAMEGARRAVDIGEDGMLSDSEALEAVARDAIAQQQAATEQDAADPRRIVVLYECKRCSQSELDTGAGAVALDDAAAAALGCSAKVRDLDSEGRVVKRGGQVPAAVLRAVRLRDRNRCRNEACGRRRYVDVHHLESRETGGVHSRKNLCCLCSTCHRKLHRGELVIQGDADGELSFYDATGKPMGPTPRRAPSPSAPEDDPRGSLLDASSHAAETRLIAVMGHRGAWHADTLVQATGLDVPEISRALLMLELEGHIVRDFAGLFHPVAPLHRTGTVPANFT